MGRNEQRATMQDFCTIFSSINDAFSVVQKYLAGTVFVCYHTPVSRKGRFCRPSTDGVCSRLRRLSTPTEEYREMSTAHPGSVQNPPTFGGENANHADPLHTEPTHTGRWKRATRDQGPVSRPRRIHARTIILTKDLLNLCKKYFEHFPKLLLT